MVNRVNRTTAYQDIKRRYEIISNSTLRINMAKARSDKLTLKEKVNLIDICKSHSQSATISRLDEEYDNQRDLSSTPETCLDAPKWQDSIPEFCCEIRLI